MKTILRFFVRQFDKARSVGTLPDQRFHGKWRVIYPAKGIHAAGQSQRLNYDTACDYAEIFNGKVIHARYETEKSEQGKEI